MMMTAANMQTILFKINMAPFVDSSFNSSADVLPNHEKTLNAQMVSRPGRLFGFSPILFWFKLIGLICMIMYFILIYVVMETQVYNDLNSY